MLIHMLLICYLCSKPYTASKVKKRTPLKYMRIDQFLMKLYVQQGGMLPTQFLCCRKKTESLANAESIKLWQIHEPKPCS